MAEPLQRRTDDDGGKYYEHPSRTEEVPQPAGSVLIRPARYVSVTTALQVVNKDALKFWAANLAARRAMENIPALIGAARIDDCGRSRARVEPLGCKVCTKCIEAWVALFHVGETERRAREGSAAHDVFERWILRGDWVYVPRAEWGEWAPTQDEMRPYIVRLQEFIQDFGLDPESFLVAECTVWNHTLKYAGTLDAIVDIRPITKKAADLCARINLANGRPPEEGVRVLVDLKSREGEDAAIYAEYALQLAPYRFAETMTPRNAAPEMEASMIATDGAVILQVRPDGYTLRPVITDGQTMKAFRAVLDLSAWSTTLGSDSTLVKAFPRPDGWKAPTWERATLADGTLCPCVGCDDPGDGRCLAQHDAVRPVGRHTKKPPAPKPLLAPSAKLGVGAGADGDELKPPPRKRAPRKRAAAPATGPSTTMESMIRNQRVIGAEIDDESIPF